MQDLRLVGVHDDGEHLLLSGTGGEMFQLPIDEALRLAASRSPAKVAAKITPVAMSPRDIQARIRSGATAAEVSELSGIPLAKVQRYEGPVLAEREYVAQQARKIEVASPAPGHDVYRSAFGDNPATLGDMVAHRLNAHGIESSSVEWDSWRRPDGTWTVVARFETNPGGHASIGEEPPAMWTFSPARKSLQNANRWAQQLSELEPLDGPIPARRLSAVSDRPFDFETDADAAAARTASGQPGKDSDGLLDMLRSRRGQRLGVDEDADDALALLLTNGVPAAHPRPSEVVAEPEPDDGATGAGNGEEDAAPAAKGDSFTRKRDGRASMLSRLSLAPRPAGDEDQRLKLHDGVSTETREITIVASPLRPVTEPDDAPPEESGSTTAALDAVPQRDASASPEPAPAKDTAPVRQSGWNRESAPNVGLDELLGGGSPRRKRDDAPAASRNERETEQPERQPSKPKRSSVPSWDEIVFGPRGD
ncbi:septation protein SepH [Arthrobacter sp. B10-11]|uniref:septation protein SepH n=1 Tax=Arthrobacter sp. B10-11 TaxID=3081160 RepID=UPI0029532154|nr:septation protein SepH [Arthrobacter sp. B10-11]MDV8148500.1 septation protein SepH [Arthrobacter sp. B10-11]